MQQLSMTLYPYYTSAQITSRLCLSHHSLFIQGNYTILNNNDKSIIMTKTLIIHQLYFDLKPVSAKQPIMTKCGSEEIQSKLSLCSNLII